MAAPSDGNGFLAKQAELLIKSYLRLTARPLLTTTDSEVDISKALFDAPFAVASHNTDQDPLFNYANQSALDLFEMSWPEMSQLPSRISAESVTQEERDQLLARVAEAGFIDDYRGVRISSTGRRFLIEDATVWNVLDVQGEYRGQAAVIRRWSQL